jgi:hypothetical protein
MTGAGTAAAVSLRLPENCVAVHAGVSVPRPPRSRPVSANGSSGAGPLETTVNWVPGAGA